MAFGGNTFVRYIVKQAPIFSWNTLDLNCIQFSENDQSSLCYSLLLVLTQTITLSYHQMNVLVKQHGTLCIRCVRKFVINLFIYRESLKLFISHYTQNT